MNWHARAGLAAPLVFGAGAALYLSAGFEPSWAILAAMSIFFLLLRLFAGAGIAGILAIFALSACLGAVVTKMRAAMVAAPRVQIPTASVVVEGRVTRIEAGRTHKRLRIRVTAMQGMTADETPHLIRISHAAALRVGPGRAVRCRVRLLPPPAPSVRGDYNFRLQAYFQRLGAVGFALGACAPAENAPPRSALTRLSARIDAIRRQIAEYVNDAAHPAGGMAAAMVSGDRSFVPVADVLALRAAGLGHLLAISGLHMGLVAGVIFFAIRRLWPLTMPLAHIIPAPKAAAVCALLAATAYLILSGGSVSTQRAWVMVAVGMTAILLDRSALSLGSLAIAMWVVLICQPESVLTPGFQMSFAATAALIALYEAWSGRIGSVGPFGRVQNWAMSLLASSAVASLATAPFALHHFGRSATLAVPANLLAMPVVSFVTVPSAVLGGLLAPFSTTLADPLYALMGRSLGIVLDVARWAKEHGPMIRDLPPMPDASLIGYVLMIALAVLGWGSARGLALVPLCFSLALWGLSSRPFAHITADGSVYVRDSGMWQIWRTDTSKPPGLRPLAIDGDVQHLSCEANPCHLRLPAGDIMFDTEGDVLFVSKRSGRRIMLPLARALERGGASLRAGPLGEDVRFLHGPKHEKRRWD